MRAAILDQLDTAALAEVLHARVEGKPKPLTGISTDTRSLTDGNLFFAIKGDTYDGHAFIDAAFKAGAAAAVVGQEYTGPADAGRAFLRVDETVQALGRLAAHARRNLGQPTIIGITGSNGKTSTKELLSAALSSCGKTLATQGNFNNHIGVPMTLFGLVSDTEYAIIEMGTEAPGEISYLAGVAGPDISLITNIGDTHLKYLKNRQGVAEEKADLYRALGEKGIGVINADDAFADFFRGCLSGPAVSFGLTSEADIRGEVTQSDPEGFMLRVDGNEFRCGLPGIHNASNLLAALGCCRAAGLEIAEFEGAFENLEIPGMRMERLSRNGIEFVNDAYNANLQSMQAALDFLRALQPNGAGRRIFVCGEMRDLGPEGDELHAELGRAIDTAVAEVLITVGDLTIETAQAAEGNAHAPHVIACADVNEAAAAVKAQARPGDIVYLKASRSVGLEKVLESF